jgi:hypothetical protein
VLVKRGDPAKSLFEQHLRVALPFLGGLLNLPPKLTRDVRQAQQQVITGCGKATVHLPSESREFLSNGRELGPHLTPHDCELGLHLTPHGCELGLHLTPYGCELGLHLTPHGCELGPYLTPHGSELGPHLAAYVRTINVHSGTELQNLRFHRTHALTEGSDLRRQCLEPFHGLLQAFYAIRRQFVRHHSSASTRRSTSTRGFDGWTNASCVATTLPSSRRVDNSLGVRTGRWTHADVSSASEGV